MENRIKSLANYLEVDEAELTEGRYDNDTVEYGNQEYLILTDNEADTKAREYIIETLWAFNYSFISSYFAVDIDEKTYRLIVENQCESANPLILILVKDRLDDLIADTIASDGRGHLLSSYDGNEYEHGDYYIYRIN